jgi:hypothetical protein
MALSERIRAQVRTETGIDFAKYRRQADRIVVSDPDLGGRLLRDAVLISAAGLGVVVLVVGLVVATDVSGVAAFLAVLGSLIAGLGVAALVAAGRARIRIPTEIDAAFGIASRVADEASDELTAVSASAEHIVRGLVIVSAIPALAAILTRRLVLVGVVARPFIERMLTRVADRGIPAVIATMPDAAPRVQTIATSVAVSRDRVVGRARRLSRWVTVPLTVVGGTAAALGVVVVLAALSFGMG